MISCKGRVYTKPHHPHRSGRDIGIILLVLAGLGGITGCKMPGFGKSSDDEPSLPSYESFVAESSEPEPASDMSSTSAPNESGASDSPKVDLQTPALDLLQVEQAASASSAAFNSGSSPTLRINGVQPNQGPIRVAAFLQADNFPDQQRASLKIDIPSNANSVQSPLQIAPDASYAVAVYQDLNSDGKLNRSSFGMPTEPYGFSQNAVGKMGPPSFQQAQVAPGIPDVEIDLQPPISGLPF